MFEALLSQVPDGILNNAALNEAIAVLPRNYGFEVLFHPPQRVPGFGAHAFA